MTGTPNFRRLAAILAVLAMSLAAGVAPASAFEVKDRGAAALDGKVVMSPAAERIETVDQDGGEQVGPGSVIRRPIIIHNRTEETIEYDIDVAQVVGADAELIVDVRHGVREGAAAWVELERPSFALEPGQQGTMFITVRVPERVTPGSKPFAVTATQRSQQVQTEGAGIAPQFKQVAIFIVELPGDAPVKGGLVNASITSAQKGIAAARDGKPAPRNARFYVGPKWIDGHRLTLSAEYENEGERLLKPRGRVVVRDLFGRQAGSYEIPEFTVYPEGEAAQTVELKGLPSLGVFRARVELESDAAGKQTTTLPRFVMVPKWFLVAAAAFLVYWTYRLAVWQLRRRREWRRYLEAEDAGTPVDGEAFDDDDLDATAWELDDEPERV